MEYAVYADSPRRLSVQEQAGLSEALEAIVPSGGCIGPRGSQQQEEVYFTVDAATEEEAKQQAGQFMNRILQEAGLEIAFVLEISQR
ncbi:hypothetical protein Plim_3189 [Planctopirus limnophila DSM 3776]|uniref:Uncharacterized protein n=1 Tax=Planctopirus limnophila (strain ATCC 43296 / DSM 3776 / IFAM 1008 / Mu 290) TaxID=521674 RepID=D5STH4_PLAL2|nr:hypothetical protein [Planctopirus limnophila]ADG69003.1 hypothetical protein Plim_3189 [Planctopirus limnophila DSM 3776]